MIMQSKVSEATRLYWVCQLFGHWFKMSGELCHMRGECRVCKAVRNFDVVWPRPYPKPPPPRPADWYFK